MKKLGHHFIYYFALILVEVSGLLFVLANTHNRTAQTNLVLIMSAFYVLWAIAHHYVHHTITTKIVIEYILVGILGVTLSALFI